MKCNWLRELALNYNAHCYKVRHDGLDQGRHTRTIFSTCRPIATIRKTDIHGTETITGWVFSIAEQIVRTLKSVRAHHEDT